jgi:hypothetical protein
MLSHGCHDQELISSTLLELHRLLGSSFTVREWEGFLQPGEASQRTQNIDYLPRNNTYEGVKQQLTPKKLDSTPMFSGRIGDYEQVL